MKLYTYNKLEAEYTELDERTLINLLIAGERRNVFVSLSEENTNDRSYFRRAKDEDIKEYLKRRPLNVKVDVDMAEVKQYVNDTIELLKHDVLIGINKDLELPTIYIDGDKVEGGIVDLDLRWVTERDNRNRHRVFRLNTLSKHNEQKMVKIEYER